jgi:transposase, IS605 orfB family
MIVQRVEKHVVKTRNSYYSLLCEYTHKAKNLYNHANYLIRQEFCKNNKWLRFGELDKILRDDLIYDDYRQMPSAQSAQQLLRLVDRVWISFFRSIKDWSKNPDKYLGKPKLPKYKSKDGNYVLVLTSQEVKLKGDKLKFPRKFKGFEVKPRFVDLDNYVAFKQVRVVPNYNSLCVELVYTVDIPDNNLEDNGCYLGIDIGLDNLATVVNNKGCEPFVINGKGLKSINKYYNKQMSYYRSISKKVNNKDYTNRIARLTEKRNLKVDDYLHKASRRIVDYAIENNYNTIVIGDNKNWKQNSKLSKVVNQSFIGLPHKNLISMVQYKAQNVGINVLLTEENYTSGTSFLDNELPRKENYNKKRRVSRGLFVSNKGVKINADVNGAYQILRKVFPEVNSDGIEGVALHPVKVGIV